MKYTLNWEPFDVNEFHVIGDTQYPVGWFFDKTNRVAMGIVEEEGEPEPEPAVVVPSSVTRRQARQALLLRGLLDQVPAKLAAVADPVQRGMAQIEWEDSTEFNRNRPLLIQIGKALGLDDAGIDDLFIFAATL